MVRQFKVHVDMDDYQYHLTSTDNVWRGVASSAYDPDEDMDHERCIALMLGVIYSSFTTRGDTCFTS